MESTSEPENPITARYAANATRNREVLEKLRGRADTTAKTFGTLATTGVTALGITKIGDIYPFERGMLGSVFLLFLGFGLMAGVVAFFTARLWRVSKPILARTDPGLMKDDLNKPERKLVKKVYKEAAVALAVPSIAAYGRRGDRIERIADVVGDDASAKKLRERAAAIGAVLDATMSRAAALVVRKRAGDVVRSWRSLFAFALFAVGAVLFAVSSDRIESARGSEISVAKSCAEARTAGADEAKLPEICGDAPVAKDVVALAKACADARAAKALETTAIEDACGKPPTTPVGPTPTAADEVDAAFLALAQARTRCRAAHRTAGGGQPPSPCAPLDRAILEALTDP